MPGPKYFSLLNDALPQRTAPMQTDIVHGSDRAIHIGDADHFVTAGKFFGFVVGGKVGLGGDLYERHIRSQEDWRKERLFDTNYSAVVDGRGRPSLQGLG